MSTTASAIKERPILFSAPMVRALLAGTKTQTRRIVKPQPPGDCEGADPFQDDPCDWMFKGPTHRNAARSVNCSVGDAWIIRCPYGKPGDQLWVREAFSPVPSSAYRGSTGVQQTEDPNRPGMCAVYAADWTRSAPTWKPSIHMPRWASRISLEITDVRVQRLQDISEGDAIAEGWPKAVGDFDAPAPGNGGPFDWYRHLWSEINGAGSWNLNPWVWALTFRSINHG